MGDVGTELKVSGFRKFRANVGALIIRIGFGGQLYFLDYDKESRK